MNYEYIELTDKEVQEYRDGGYTVEEYSMGGITNQSQPMNSLAYQQGQNMGGEMNNTSQMLKNYQTPIDPISKWDKFNAGLNGFYDGALNAIPLAGPLLSSLNTSKYEKDSRYAKQFGIGNLTGGLAGTAASMYFGGGLGSLSQTSQNVKKGGYVKYQDGGFDSNTGAAIDTLNYGIDQDKTFIKDTQAAGQLRINQYGLPNYMMQPVDMGADLRGYQEGPDGIMYYQGQNMPKTQFNMDDLVFKTLALEDEGFTKSTSPTGAYRGVTGVALKQYNTKNKTKLSKKDLEDDTLFLDFWRWTLEDTKRQLISKLGKDNVTEEDIVMAVNRGAGAVSKYKKDPTYRPEYMKEGIKHVEKYNTMTLGYNDNGMFAVRPIENKRDSFTQFPNSYQEGGYTAPQLIYNNLKKGTENLYNQIPNNFMNSLDPHNLFVNPTRELHNIGNNTYMDSGQQKSLLNSYPMRVNDAYNNLFSQGGFNDTPMYSGAEATVYGDNTGTNLVGQLSNGQPTPPIYLQDNLGNTDYLPPYGQVYMPGSIVKEIIT